ncbi:unnamed protein product [Caenorhabditis auriculariae]|uniref:Dihydroorotate dehydrogenase (quinone), mitochondrial n=1 Tax=Caenorhabditis auriculariae TaxID=2777116 RepID=A0A8S1GNP7_9PELO|nr:unnamed protein product [Caenorhabditis auriculariae]
MYKGRYIYQKLPPGQITKSTVIVLTSGLVGYTFLELLGGSENFYNKGAMPLVHRFIDGEKSHRWAVRAASWGLLPRWGWNRKEYPELHCVLFGRDIKNPVGLAAGFDKNGDAIESLAEVSGLGMVEIGSVTPIPQPGNNRPRVFRLLEDEGVINRYGFNSDGVGRVQQRVRTARDSWRSDWALLGVNLGKNKMSEDALHDYEIGINYFAPHCDYLVLNISSPNTPGLRSMQKKSDLEKLLLHAKKALDLHQLEKRPQMFLKIAPDLIESELKDIAQVVSNPKFGIDGLIISNTTISRPTSLRSENKDESGGLSGKPVGHLSTECIRTMYKLTEGKVVIIGCGGIASGQDAYDKIRAGASLVQLYTAIVFQGFPVIGKVKRELVQLLRRDGFANVSEAVGADHRSGGSKNP